MRNLRWWYALALASAATVLLLPGTPGSAAERAAAPKLIRDVKTGSDKLGSLTPDEILKVIAFVRSKYRGDPKGITWE